MATSLLLVLGTACNIALPVVNAFGKLQDLLDDYKVFEIHHSSGCYDPDEEFKRLAFRVKELYDMGDYLEMIPKRHSADMMCKVWVRSYYNVENSGYRQEVLLPCHDCYTYDGYQSYYNPPYNDDDYSDVSISEDDQKEPPTKDDVTSAKQQSTKPSTANIKKVTFDVSSSVEESHQRAYPKTVAPAKSSHQPDEPKQVDRPATVVVLPAIDPASKPTPATADKPPQRDKSSSESSDEEKKKSSDSKGDATKTPAPKSTQATSPPNKLVPGTYAPQKMTPSKDTPPKALATKPNPSKPPAPKSSPQKAPAPKPSPPKAPAPKPTPKKPAPAKPSADDSSSEDYGPPDPKKLIY